MKRYEIVMRQYEIILNELIESHSFENAADERNKSAYERAGSWGGLGLGIGLGGGVGGGIANAIDKDNPKAMLAGLLAGGALGGVTGRGIGSAIGKGADKNSNEEMKGMTAKQKLAHNRIKAAIAGGTIGGTWVTPIVGAPVGALIGRARYDAHREESSKKR